MKCMVFDFDGPIFNSRTLAQKSLDSAIKELNLERYNINFYDKTLLHPEILIKLIGLETNLPIETERELLCLYQEKLYKEENETRIGEDICSVINRLKEARIMLAIYTNRNTENVSRLLKKSGLQKYFEVVCGRDVIEPKPSTEFFYYLIEKYNIKKQDIVFVGDTDTDYLSAKECGIYYVHAKYSEELCNLSWKNCNYLLETPSELKKVAEKLLLEYGI